MKNETIGERIRKLRKSRGITLQQLAQKTGVTLQTISQVERGLHASVKAEQLWLYAKHLDTSMEYLLNGLRESKHGVPILHDENLYSLSMLGLGELPGGVIYTDRVMDDGVFAYDLNTDALLPDIPTSCRAYVQSKAKPKNGDFVLALDGGGVIARVYSAQGSKAFLTSPIYPMIEVSDTVVVIGVIIEAEVFF